MSRSTPERPELVAAAEMGDTRPMVSNAASAPTRRGRRFLRLLPIGAILLLLAGCGDAFKAHPQNTFKPEGKNARSIDHLIVPIFGIAGVVFVLVLGGCLLIILKFRAKDDDDYNDFPHQLHGNFKAEITWTIAPALILLAVAVPTVMTVFKLNEKPAANALHVEVIGQQWWWEYRYDLNNDGKFDDLVTANDLVIPAGREVALTVTSRDVIHSFWVPELNGKRDAVPNRMQPWKLQADKPGEYIGQCTEFCGLSHAEMRIKAVAMTEANFATWVTNQQKKQPTYKATDNSAAALGYRVFTQQLCSSCHLIEGVNDDKFAKTVDEGPNKGQPAELGRIAQKKLQTSRHAPNLTHFVSRSTFAGAKFNLRKDTPACRALGENWADDDTNLQKCINRSALEAWIRNPPGQKAMAPVGVPGRSLPRGMPNLNLSEQQINQVVDYLETLK